ncbi:protein phosphatase type 1 complex subunit Hex2/Reg1 [Hirsutella rhossiliensis]|uniref:Protein phosphatase type 1 complex subunit Hex2/Reg1 n=1 Tax=Hirsutella rhossiliensis TaxID=111463 RepID=A0A9P8ML66_9HYPO|nr:protein phosphatase type 1 complex subunit Hex2/Reg1 [Hirsutella rhossiliensis]KAH0957362.1 protein phosphatase type 1 complex subunit Hex2/Reg1 [Hirsutella rhossiliensis]
MAAVLSSSEDSSYFGAASLRRSQSQPTFVGAPSPRFPAAHSIGASYSPPSKFYPDSELSSSPPTIQTESTDVSLASTPASNLSISSDYDDTLALDEDSPDDHFSLPLLSQDKFYLHPEIQHDDNLEPPPSPKTGDSFNVSPADADTSALLSGSETPDRVEHAEDDSAIATKPSRQVDYLSHDWKEEDIWSSWRYIVAKRGEFPNSKRLENASWRTWMKAKNNLKTISAEELNWLKDCDVTWLYGPLQSGSSRLHPTQTEPSSESLSKSESLVNLDKKPILKKRSMSEVMLQRSLTSSSLLKQATAAVQAQETRAVLRPTMARASTDCYLTFPLSARRSSADNNSSVTQSTDSSGFSSPFPERKHIHFNEQVEQCIAVDVKGDDEDDEADVDRYGEDSDSDDGVVMKRVRSKKRAPLTRKRTKKAAPAEGKTIAMLPSTTLKYREDTPEPYESAMKHGMGVYSSPMISPSSSQETLRPTKQASAFYFGEEEDYEIKDGPQSPPSGWRSPPFDRAGGGLQRSTSTGSLSDQPVGMRRTSSGMFMPFEGDESSTGDGILGRVIDTVNTARDIAHVIWNVGWRK